MTSQTQSSGLFWPVISVMVAATIGLYLFMNSKERQKQEAAAAARAVSVLPHGTQEQWEAYVTQRLGKMIIRDGDQLRVIDNLDELLDNPPTIISRNMPYTIECDDFRGTVEFGGGDDSVSVTAFETDDKAPTLPVNEYSIAAGKLGKDLCEIVVAYVSRATRQ